MTDLTQIWNSTLIEIKKDMKDENFNTWFKDTYVDKYVDGTIYIAVPNMFSVEWLHQKYHKTILRIIRNLSENIRSVEYCIAKKQASQKQPVILDSNQVATFIGLQKQKHTVGVGVTPQLPIKGGVNRQTNLNPRYSLDSYILGPFNELAYSAGKAIIHKPGVYNPLYIYGETGLGKTHLIQAIGNTLKQNHGSLTVYYISSEQFTNDYISAVRNQRMPAFRDKYRKYDVLIMDDIQFLSGKDQTQEELFHLFNTLYNHNKQIIFSSDKHPNMIIGLEDRLRSRFSQGMVVDINRPEYESRVSILMAKALDMGYQFEPSIIEYIASHVEGNVRELEGIINSLAMQMQLQGTPLTTQDVKHYIRNHIKPKKQVSIEDIIEIISRFYSINKDLIYAKTRRKEVVQSRQVAMYILREDYSISYPMIGKKVGGRDHTTVIHSCDKIKRRLEEEPNLVNEIEQLRSILSAK